MSNLALVSQPQDSFKRRVKDKMKLIQLAYKSLSAFKKTLILGTSQIIVYGIFNSEMLACYKYWILGVF